MITAFWRAAVKANWSPNFKARPLPENVIGASSGPVAEGASIFYSKGCLNCHLVKKYGGRRGPNLTYIADKLTREEMILRTSNGGINMPAYGNNLTPAQLDALIAFLQSRRSPTEVRAEKSGQ